MSRRHKTKEELERLQSRQRGSQGGCSLKASPDENHSASDHNVLNHFLVVKRDSSISSFSLDKVIDAITKSICSIELKNFHSMGDISLSIGSVLDDPYVITEHVKQAVVEECMAQMESEENESLVKRGRRKINQLLNSFKNSEVVSWFDKIRTKFADAIANLKELMVCFFCALFKTSPSESRHGKATFFYKMIEAHLKEKIPSMSMFQKALKWFKGWRIEVTPWKDKRAEEEEHGIWERLYLLIMKELPILEPRLAIC